MAQRKRIDDLIVYGITGLLMLLAYAIARADLYDKDGDFVYWSGVAGGSLLALLLTYPLRKYATWFRALGKMKHWLHAHMTLGILAPILILIHCSFDPRSINATVAYWSMLTVMGSGIIGRFLFTRTAYETIALRKELAKFKTDIELDSPLRSALWFAPIARELLLKFEAMALSAETAAHHWFLLLCVLPVKSWVVRFKALRNAKHELRVLAQKGGWSIEDTRERTRFTRIIIVQHLTYVMQLALIDAWHKVFALWHVAHIPVVFLLAFSSIFHIIAVHIY